MKGNAQKPIGIERAGQPKQPGQGANTPKGTKAAKPYTGAKAVGSPEGTQKFGR
jgi:hypothetical protein